MSISGVGSCGSNSTADQVQRLLALKSMKSVALNAIDPVGGNDGDGDDAPGVASAPGAASKGDSFRSDLMSLFSAVKSGDLTAAQSALTALGNDRQNATYGPRGTSQNAQSPIARDVQTLASALQSGDTAGAQKALQSLQTDLAAHGAHGHHHHHHHGGGGGGLLSPATDPSSASAPFTAPILTGSTGSTGSTGGAATQPSVTA